MVGIVINNWKKQIGCLELPFFCPFAAELNHFSNISRFVLVKHVSEKITVTKQSANMCKFFLYDNIGDCSINSFQHKLQDVFYLFREK